MVHYGQFDTHLCQHHGRGLKKDRTSFLAIRKDAIDYRWLDILEDHSSELAWRMARHCDMLTYPLANSA